MSLTSFFRLSRRFYALAGDSELWKRQYYSRWVRPRARRLANVRRTTLPRWKFEYSPRVSTWFGHGHLAEEGKVTNWKRQYRLRHNWSKGICRVTAVELPQPPLPPFLAKLCAGILFTVDSAYGLRAWIAKNPKSCVASAPFSGPNNTSTAAPTALTAAHYPPRNTIQVTVGFQDGRFSIYDLDIKSSRLYLRSSHGGSTDGTITAMASSSPYLLMVSQHKVLSLYEMPVEFQGTDIHDSPKGPRLLASLKADSIVAPMSLSIRISASEIIASIVYSFFHLGCGWSLGIQELRLSRDGQQIGSRLATTVDSQYGVRPLQTASRSRSNPRNDDELWRISAEPSILHQQPPTSMSYSHPYLLTSHADNTLTMYLVVSTSESLFVKSGKRLWGHTSSVSAVQVSDRGKAVSVSSFGDEIRIWELETVISSSGTRKALQDENSIQISPENKRCRKPQDLDLISCTLGYKAQFASGDTSHELGVMRGCVGFDDERVLLLREKEIGTQLLECYDFT